MLQKNRLLSIASAVALAYAFVLSSAEVRADQTTYLSDGASYCEIFQAINPDVPDHCHAELGNSAPAGRKTRSIKIHQAKQAAQGTLHGAAADGTQSGPYTAAMNIQFKFDSSELTSEAIAMLDQVANVLNSELMDGKSVIVEGHTDAVGTDSYNLALSMRRAFAVQFYLVKQHLIPVDRLPVTGKGETELFDPENPYAALNRRVEFTNLNG